LPYFAKAEWSLSRLQGIADDWSLLAGFVGQLASGTLYASEEFGYGGQAFGRAYDSSDITGDEGISGMLELCYDGWSGDKQDISLQPYGFYDIGAVWRTAAGPSQYEHGASTGAGIRFATPWSLTGNIGLAWPIGRAIVAPSYNALPAGPRILLQTSYGF
jgi:hemolysin activation/secretion protein